jgi:hypothetical protein
MKIFQLAINLSQSHILNFISQRQDKLTDKKTGDTKCSTTFSRQSSYYITAIHTSLTGNKVVLFCYNML